MASPASSGSSRGRAAPSLEEVRRELRDLGYLRDPLGGLIAPQSEARATFARVSLLTSVRAGIVGAILLAVPLAAALGYLSRPHFRGVRDHLFLALYLLPVLAAALFVLSLLGDLIVRALARGTDRSARSGERLAAGAGALLAAVSSLYLALVWSRPGGGRGGPALAAGLVLIVGAGLLVGWLIRSGALVAIASLGGRLESAARTGRPISLIGAAAGVGAVAFAAAVVLRPSTPPPRPLPPITRAEVPGRLIVVGVDGLDESWFGTLAARLDLSALRRIEQGAARFSLRPTPAAVPPEVWTTLATGATGEVHGVRAFEVHHLPGLRSPILAGPAAPAARATFGPALRLLALIRPQVSAAAPLSSLLRRSRAVWEIMAAAGFPPAVVNWWGTWPAQAEGCLTVSDRALGFLLSGGAEAAGGEDLVSPRTLWLEVRAAFPTLRREVESRFAAAMPAGEAGAWFDLLASAFLIDGYHLDVAATILASRPVKALFLYLPGQDIITESLLRDREQRAPPLGPALWTVTAQEVLLRELDRGLAGLIAGLGPDDLLILVGDPGRFFRGDRASEARGFLYIFGGRVRTAGAAGGGSDLDVAPTLLALAGLPTAEDLPGKVLDGIRTAIRGPIGEGRIATFGDRSVEAVAGLEGSEEVLDRLRSLGYIR